jgi:hypothetical protein
MAKDTTEKAKSKEEVPKKYLKTGREASGKEVEKPAPLSISNTRWKKSKSLSRLMN